MVDGSVTGNEWCSMANNIGWFEIDLGAQKTASKIQIWPVSAISDTIHFKIEGSDDDASFTDIVASGSCSSDITATTWYTSPDLAVSCRYVRVMTDYWSGSWVAVKEFQIFGY